MRDTLGPAAACFLLSLSLASLQAQPSRLPARIDNGQTVILQGRVHALATARNDLGRVVDSFQLPAITLMLRPSAAQQAELQQWLAEQQDPASPNFHQWLTPEQYADRFGVSAGDIGKISEWLTSQGFSVSGVARSRAWITFSGTAAQTQSAFRTEIHRYSVNGGTHYANATPPAIPAALAGMVAGFQGLHDFHPKPRSVRREFTPEMTTSFGNHQMAPDDFATIYDVAPLYTAGVDGTGQKLVVVGQTAINLSDITAFRNKFNLGPANLQQVLVPRQGNPGISQADIGEADLDIEWAGAIARNATVIYVYSNDVWQSARYAVDQNLAPVLSMSYGQCEQSDLVDLPTFQSVVLQAISQGMTWLAAAGDSGAADCEDVSAVVAQDGLAVDAPGSIPEVTSMGGTEFNDQAGAYWNATNDANGGSARSYIPEKAWNDTANGGGLSATGGGSSVVFARPPWQTSLGPNDTARHVPDVAFSASPDHVGYYVYTGGSGAVFGGTSVAAPPMAGIVTLLNQYLVSSGAQKQPGVGNINPTLYRLAQTPGIFHDVTTGDNIVPCSAGSPNCSNGTLGFSAGPGYDQVTGLGSIDAYNLIHQWSGKPAAVSAVVPSIDQPTVYQQPPDANGNGWRFTLTLTEEAGIGTKLTGFTVDGANYTAQIGSLFGTNSIAPRGSISAAMGLKSVAAPKTVTFTFSGVDATGAQWSTELAVPFSGPQVRLTVGGVSNAATGQQAFAPGMLLSVYGTQLGEFPQSAGELPLPQYLAGFEATINGITAPLYYVSPGQVNLQIPYETRPGTATLIVGNPIENYSFTFRVSAAGPGIFTFADGTINPQNSGSRGQVVTLFITGDGAVKPSLATGATPSSSTPLALLPKPQLGVTVTVGGVPADIKFMGIPNGLVGVTQINYTIPAAAPLGAQQVVVTVGTVASPPASFTVTQ